LEKASLLQEKEEVRPARRGGQTMLRPRPSSHLTTPRTLPPRSRTQLVQEVDHGKATLVAVKVRRRRRPLEPLLPRASLAPRCVTGPDSLLEPHAPCSSDDPGPIPD
jgi:hypothetical protein